jgi:hypothetical protein
MSDNATDPKRVALVTGAAAGALDTQSRRYGLEVTSGS